MQHIYNLSCAEEDKIQVGRIYSKISSRTPQDRPNETFKKNEVIIPYVNYVKPKIFPKDDEEKKINNSKKGKSIGEEPSKSRKRRVTPGRNDKHRIVKPKEKVLSDPQISDELLLDNEEDSDEDSSDTLSDYSEVDVNYKESKKEKK
jgi:hypothetical protein